MCIGKGQMIIRGEESPRYLWDSNDHEPMVKAFGLRDDKPAELRDFVRVECLPLGSLTSTDPNDWEIHWDVPGVLPGWFEEDEAQWREKCLGELVTIIVPHWMKDGVGGSLYLQDTKVESLGSLKSVGSSLYLQYTKVELINEAKKKNLNIITL